MSNVSDIPEFDHKSFLKNLTRQPGVYQMYDHAGKVLYVGKAKNLKNRVSSYFHRGGLHPKTQALVQRIHSIEITVAASEAEALLLEQNLIKAQRPPFNILLRDDKSYPYIFLSDGEDYPRLALHRGPKKMKGRYFGPFPSAGAVRESLQFLQKTFRVRQCEDSVFRNRSRPCLQYQIDRCTGPCVKLIDPEAYAADVRHTVMFLEGKNESLHEELVEEMNKAAENLEFEKAAAHRDQITALRQVQAQHSAESGSGNVDVIACALESGEVCLHVLFVRQGRVLGSKSYFPKDPLGDNESGILGEFLAQFYLSDRAMDIPAEVVISHPVEEADALVEAVRQARGKSINLSDSVRTHRAKWLAMAIEAARQNLRARLGSQQTLLKKYEALQVVLQLDEMPERMECFDISHSSGERPVASCVVFDRNGPVKSDYRRFNIEDIQAGDDYAAMEQALTRRYSRLQKEGKSLPSLLIVDGGKGQLGKARQVMQELGIQSIVLLGVAKGTTRKPGFETLILEDGREQVLASDDPALHLIQQIRDEAHRFAVTGHKQARDKLRRRSRLEDIAGVGPTRRRQLLNHFGGLQEVMRASVDDIAKVPGISKKLAQEVYSVLHSE
jgi:excinuclease ABC subunit C